MTDVFNRNFETRGIEQFRLMMEPHALGIYRRLFPGVEKENLRQEGPGVHVLDKEHAIDSILRLPSGITFTLQEKYRENKYLVDPRLQEKPPCPDFTQGYKLAVGTPHESPGEWFHLHSQLYFYGWADRQCTRFEKWVLVDVAKYKILVEKTEGGLAAMGRLIANKQWSATSFYAFPILLIRRVWLASEGFQPRTADDQIPLFAGGSNDH
jgi:hypothetical protein